MTVERLRDPEIGLVVDHLRACSPSEPLGDTPMLGEVMARVRVAAVERAVGGTRRMPDKSKYDFPLRSAAKALGVSPSSYFASGRRTGGGAQERQLCLSDD